MPLLVPLRDVGTNEEGEIVGVLSELYGQILHPAMLLAHLPMFRGLDVEPA